MLQDIKLKSLAMINKDKSFFQYNGGDSVYIISLLTSQLSSSSKKLAIMHAGHSVIFRIIDPHKST